jgi:1-deoxy-D-xylulose-5-phosphate reductoisomerase
MPAVMNAANEVAVVEYFLKERIRLGEIPHVVKAVMDEHESENIEKPTLENILKADVWARKRANSLIRASL